MILIITPNNTYVNRASSQLEADNDELVNQAQIDHDTIMDLSQRIRELELETIENLSQRIRALRDQDAVRLADESNNQLAETKDVVAVAAALNNADADETESDEDCF